MSRPAKSAPLAPDCRCGHPRVAHDCHVGACGHSACSCMAYNASLPDAPAACPRGHETGLRHVGGREWFCSICRAGGTFTV